MQTALQIINLALVGLYGLAFALYARHFVRDKDKDHNFIGAKLLYGILALHVVFEIARGIQVHAFPLSTKSEFMSLLALCIMSVYALAERELEPQQRDGAPQTGVFFLAIAVPFQLLSAALWEPSIKAPVLLENPIYGLHVISIVLGFTGLAVGALYAIMYILLARQLKSHELGVFFKRLPPLLKLERMSKRSTTAGIFTLGLGLALGHYVAIQAIDGLSLSDPKILLMDLAWLAYFVGFVVVKVRGLSGLRAGYLALAGYVLLMVTVVISNVILSSFHSFQ